MLRWLLSALVFVGIMTVVITAAMAAYEQERLVLFIAGVLSGGAAAGLTCYFRPESFSSPQSLRAALRRLEAGE